MSKPSLSLEHYAVRDQEGNPVAVVAFRHDVFSEHLLAAERRRQSSLRISLATPTDIEAHINHHRMLSRKKELEDFLPRLRRKFLYELDISEDNTDAMVVDRKPIDEGELDVLRAFDAVPFLDDSEPAPYLKRQYFTRWAWQAIKTAAAMLVPYNTVGK